MTEEDRSSGLDVAIIGLSCRFPGAADADEFWHNLCAGRDSVTTFSDEELLEAGVPAHLISDPSFIKTAPVLEEADRFDAAFFNYSPREARCMDPQQRVLLECAWASLEDAGYDSERMDGPVGVFAGAAMNTYLLLSGLAPEFVDNYFPTLLGNDKDFLATRVSFKLNLSGPSLTIQTACSTSLVAVHYACQSLLSGECDVALAGASAIRVPLCTGHLWLDGGVFSSDGHCRPFDANASGTVFGSGVGVVVLKRLEDALADRDHIRAVIKGSAVNNDGASKADYTSPSVVSQADAISEALANSDIDADSISYMEAHGTATSIGDSIEIEAMTRAFRRSTERKDFCSVGAVKSNIGHLDAAAGIAGLIKTTLALEHKQIPPIANFQSANPDIDFSSTPFRIPDRLEAWKSGPSPRRAGINSLGVGGTNAHAILEEAPEPEPVTAPDRSRQLLVLSAKTDSALHEVASRLSAHLRDNPDVDLADVAFTLQQGRRPFSHRRFAVCQSAEEATEVLGRPGSCSEVTAIPDAAFLFSGQGSQYVNMGRGLYGSGGVFRETVDRCVEALRPVLDLDLRDVLYPEVGAEAAATERLTQTRLAQPALFVIEYALAQQWMNWGVKPTAMAGHSIGEYVAACLADVFTLEDALKLVATRGRLMQDCDPGSMLAVFLAPDEVTQRLPEGCLLAVINSPGQGVVSGPDAVIRDFESQLQQDGVDSRILHTSHAFHSEMMRPARDAFLEVLRGVPLKAANSPFLSNSSGTWIREDEVRSPTYWADHIVKTVQFSENLAELMAVPTRILLEVGPGNALCGMASQHPHKTKDHTVIPSIRTPKNDEPDESVLMRAVGQVWAAGMDVDWSAFAGADHRRVRLPTYPFERRRFWVDETSSGFAGGQPHSNLDMRLSKGARVLPQEKRPLAEWFYLPSWTRTATPSQGTGSFSSPCLLFVDESGLGSDVETEINARGATAVCVRVGEEFARFEDHEYVIDPAKGEHYDRLLEELARSDQLPTTIIHLWSLDTPNGPLVERLGRGQELGVYSLLFLTQAIGRRETSHDFRIHVITGGIHDVIGTETIYPDQATVLGPTKVTPLEYPNIRCRSIDFTPSAHRAVQLLDEVGSGSEEPVVAFRGVHRWTPDVTSIPTGPQSDLPAARLREGGVYLITGGLSGIGLEIARMMARSVRARLILVGRTAVPAREEWETQLARLPNGDATRARLEKLISIEADGAELLVVAADVANVDQMRAVIDAAHDRFGSIQGVVHSAGVADNSGVIQKRTRVMHESSVESKVLGTIVLTQLLANEGLDFFVLNSSMSTVLYHNRFAQVGYVAANSFLDAFCQWRDHGCGHMVTIGWDDWQQVGMSVRAQEHFAQEYKISEPLFDPLDQFTPEEGVEIFVRLMSTNHERVLISTRDLALRIEQDKFVVSPFLAAAEKIQLGSANVAATADRLRRASGTGRLDAATEYVAELLANVLGIAVSELDTHKPLVSLGLDSLMAVSLINKMKSDVGVSFELRSMLAELDGAQLAEQVAESMELAAELSQPACDDENQADYVEGEL